MLAFIMSDVRLACEAASIEAENRKTLWETKHLLELGRFDRSGWFASVEIQRTNTTPW
jgi:hypothetical protein